jgi:flagellar biogenesis protein FliO
MGIIKLIFVALLVFVGFFLLKKFRKPVNTIVQQPSTNKMGI